MFGSGEPKCLYSGWVFGSETTELCERKEGVRFGREPKCVRGKTVIPRTSNVGMIRVYWA